jgi:hypothetical protein
MQWHSGIGGAQCRVGHVPADHASLLGGKYAAVVLEAPWCPAQQVIQVVQETQEE